MNFGGFFDNSSGGVERVLADIPYINMPAGAIAQPRLGAPSLATSMLSSLGLSLSLQTSMEGHGDASRIGENLDLSATTWRINKEDDYESRSGSDNMEGASGDDQDAGRRDTIDILHN